MTTVYILTLVDYDQYEILSVHTTEQGARRELARRVADNKYLPAELLDVESYELRED